MILDLRKLLCTICLVTICSKTIYAAETSNLNPETLDRQFVQIEVSNTNAHSISVLRTFQNLAQFIQARYYSLLNWKLYSRSGALEIDNYDRKMQFGRWVNDPNDDLCLNTRAKVLVRDSNRNVVFKETNNCVVEQGSWKDPYTGSTLIAASDIQIDHLVPLKNAYISGAYKWGFQARCLYANYLGYDFHLLSVFGTENMRKSDKAPDKYMPPNSRYACTYVRNWLAVKMLWGLSMTVPEANAVRQVINNNGCSMAQFKMSDIELEKQRKYAQENIALCAPPTN